MKKYYWFCMQTTLEFEGKQHVTVNDGVSMIHPFEGIQAMKKSFPERITVLLNWKEITEYEYNIVEKK